MIQNQALLPGPRAQTAGARTAPSAADSTVGLKGPNPLIRYRSNRQIDADKKREAEEKEKVEKPELDYTEYGPLAVHIRKSWERNKMAKLKVQDRLLSNLRARRNEYSATEISKMQAAGGLNFVWVDLTETKCRAASAWIREVLMPVGERPFMVAPTPLPEIPKEMEKSILAKAMSEAKAAMAQMMQAGGGVMDQQQFAQVAAEANENLRDEINHEYVKRAKKYAERMENRIADNMAEGGWEVAMDGYIEDFVTHPAAILKGPFLQRKKKLSWAPGWKPIVTNEPIRQWKWVDVFDVYPDQSAIDCQRGNFIYRDRFTRSDLFDLIGVESYHEDQIRQVLDLYSAGRLESWMWSEAERRELQNQTLFNFLSPQGIIDGICFYGQVPGWMLLDWGIKEDEVDDPLKDYDVEAILIGQFVIQCAVNRDALGRRPFWKASYDAVPGAFWGNSIPDLARTCQKMANAAASALADNMGWACLTGDTVVYRHTRSGAKRNTRHLSEVTLNELWQEKQNKGSRGSGLRRNLLRSLDEKTGQFYGNRVVDIFDNGVRPVYRVTTAHGYTIKATMNHRFMADDGDYRRLEGFGIGDLMAVNGAAVPLTRSCLDCGAELGSRKTAVRCRSCSTARWNKTQAERALANRTASQTTARGRKLVRAELKSACEACAATTRLHVHHMDRDPLNCDPANLKTLCEPCHRAWHARHDHYGKNPFAHAFLDFDSIVSIDYVGEERVFDLQMKAPNHNFVANGFVSHNSGPMVWVHADRLADGESTITIFPGKVWQLKSDPTQGVNPGIGSFSIPSNAKELSEQISFWDIRADDATGIPRYTYGNERVGGAANTYSGLAMLMNNAAKGLRRAISGIDIHVIQETVYSTFLMEMIFGKDDSVKCDAYISPRGAAAILVKEAANQARMTFLNIVSGNPALLQLVGQDRVAFILREVAKALDISPNDAVPSETEVRAQMMAMQAAQEAQMKMQQEALAAEQQGKTLEMKSKIELEREKLDAEKQKHAMDREDRIEDRKDKMADRQAERAAQAQAKAPRGLRHTYNADGDIVSSDLVQ